MFSDNFIPTKHYLFLKYCISDNTQYPRAQKPVLTGIQGFEPETQDLKRN